MSFEKYVRKNTSLATASSEEMKQELMQREASENPFPLHVFHPKVKPLLAFMVEKLDIPADYVGLSLLCAYSTAIGTGYAVKSSMGLMYLPVWGCLAGISSSGKSAALRYIFKPIMDMQAEFSQEREEIIEKMSESQIAMTHLKRVMVREVHISTLMRYVAPDNPKGLIKFHDEILEWINSMNATSKGKEGSDEQFWLSSWNCSNYDMIRSGKQTYTIPRPFINVMGGIQRKILHKLFANDRDSSGFAFRLLFTEYIDRIADIDFDFIMPEPLVQIHQKSVEVMYHSLPVESGYEDPKYCILLPETRVVLKAWMKENMMRINNLKDLADRESESGILGKIQEYAQRFAAILAISDRALNIDQYFGWNNHIADFPIELHIKPEHMERALKLAEYFRKSASNIYEMVSKNVTAPYEVIEAAVLFNKGKSYADMARSLLKSGDEQARQKMANMVRKWIKEYPTIFKAKNK